MLNKYIPNAKTPFEIVSGKNKLYNGDNDTTKLVEYSSLSDSYSSSDSSNDGDDVELKTVQMKYSSVRDGCNIKISKSSSVLSYTSGDLVIEYGISFRMLFMLFMWCIITIVLTAHYHNIVRRLLNPPFTHSVNSVVMFLLLSLVVLHAYYTFTKVVANILPTNLVRVTMFVFQVLVPITLYVL